MKCPFCNEEISQEVKVCPHCNAPVAQEENPAPSREGTSEETNSSLEDVLETKESGDFQQVAEAAGDSLLQALPENKKAGKGKWIAIGAAVVAVCGIGAAAMVMMNAKSPKERVIDAFEQAFSEEGQVSPGEEIFGWSQLAEAMNQEDIEEGFELTLSGSSMPELDMFRDSGLRFTAESSPSTQTVAFDAGVIYGGMDLLNLDAYYGEEKVLLSIPQLSSRVFLFDVSDGLADRMKASPFLGPIMEQTGFDIDAYAALMERASQQIKESSENGGRQPFDIQALMDRYREGCQAKAKFQEALTVEKGEKKPFTVNGQEMDCQGYTTFISKDSMIHFLEESSDFFLQDETLRDDFVQQLQMTAEINSIMGQSFDMGSPEEQAAETYADLEEQVDELIQILDESMSDVNMEVYLTKKGELAAVSGTTTITDDGTVVDVAFELELRGGAYRLQNMEAMVDLSSEGEHITMNILRNGIYDETTLADDVSLDFDMMGETFGGTYTSTYELQDGSFHIQVDATANRKRAAAVSLSGQVDQLEKGKVFHANLEELRMEEGFTGQYITLAGELYLKPLEGEIQPISGETFDMISASQMEWMGVGTEIIENGEKLIEGLGF